MYDDDDDDEKLKAITNRNSRVVTDYCIVKWKKLSERRKHCALAVVRRSQKFRPATDSLPWARDGQNLISWRCGHYLHLQTQFGEDRCTQFRVIMVTDPQTHKPTNPQTGPITIHCAAKLSAQCNRDCADWAYWRTVYSTWCSVQNRGTLTVLIFSKRRRSVGKYGEGRGSGPVRSSHQTASDYTLRQWFPNIQQCRFVTACRRLEKLVLSSIFLDTSLSSSMIRTDICRVIQQQFWIKECDILRRGGGLNILWPPPPGSTPTCSVSWCIAKHKANRV